MKETHYTQSKKKKKWIGLLTIIVLTLLPAVNIKILLYSNFFCHLVENQWKGKFYL